MATSGLRSFLLTGIVMFVGFCLTVGMFFWFTRQGPQNDLTQRVPADLISYDVVSRSSTNHWVHQADYGYSYDGHAYRGSVKVYSQDTWQGRGDLWLCIDPHDPRRNAPLIGSVHDCGGRDLDSRTTKASLLH